MFRLKSSDAPDPLFKVNKCLYFSVRDANYEYTPINVSSLLMSVALISVRAAQTTITQLLSVSYLP